MQNNVGATWHEPSDYSPISWPDPVPVPEVEEEIPADANENDLPVIITIDDVIAQGTVGSISDWYGNTLNANFYEYNHDGTYYYAIENHDPDLIFDGKVHFTFDGLALEELPHSTVV